MTQVWPAGDTFDHGTPVYGSTLTGYLGVQPSSTGTDWCGPGAYHDGYAGGASPAPTSGSPDEGNDALGVMRRQLFAEDCKAYLVTKLHPQSGILASGHFKRAAVFVRVQGGSLSEVNPEEAYYSDVDCYAFIIEYLSGVTITAKVSRFNSGTETILASKTGASDAVDFFHNDVIMTLSATTNGAQVDLVATVQGIQIPPDGSTLPGPIIAPGGTTGGLPTYSGTPGVGTQVDGLSLQGRPGVRGPYQAPEDISLFTINDTDASRVTGSGRAGFATDRPRDQGGGNLTTSLVSRFEVEESSTAVWRDEFVRAAVGLGASVTDLHSVTGRDLLSDYASDAHSVTADADMLTRDTATEAVEQASSLDFGKGIEFDGTNPHYLELNNPSASQGGFGGADDLGVTVCCWAYLHTNRDGHVVFGNLPASTPFEGIECAIGSGTGSNFKMRMRIGGSASLTTASGDDFPELLNQRVFFAWTYKANANTGTGEGRVRFYYGLAGAALQTAGEVLTVPSSQRPEWNLLGKHYSGYAYMETASAATLMDGVLDHLTIFSSELTQEQLNVVADPLVDEDDLLALGLQHQIDYEEQIVGSPNFYRPNYPSGVSDANSWEEDGSSPAPAYPTGLKPTGEPLISWSQRPATNPAMQSRSVRVTLDGAMSVAGLALRGTVGSDPSVYTGYLLEVGAGTPARIDVFRVLGGVKTKIARQPDDGAINVSTGIYTKLEMEVDQFDTPTGPVQILVEINDVAVVFEALPTGGGLVDDNNVLQDIGGNRILSGGAEGFLTTTDTLPTLIDDWAEGTVTPPDPNPGDFPSASIPGEGDSVSGDLEDVLTVEFLITPIENGDRVVHRFDSGHQQRILLDRFLRRGFELRGVLRTDNSEYDDFIAFWDDHNGGEVAFNFDPSEFLPGIGPAGIFCFAEDKFDWPYANRTRQVTFRIEEKSNAP